MRPAHLQPHVAGQTVSELAEYELQNTAQVNRYVCISIFCIRLELACLTKHEESTIQIFNL